MNKTSSYRFLTRTAAVAVVAVAATFLMSSNASAQSCGYGGGGGGFYGGGGFGGGGLTIGIGSGYGGGFYGGGFNRGISYSSYRPAYRRPVYHNTTHLDYHRGGVVRHGNHFDRIPGHYDVHRTGHWHR